jgi:hypothetical protein
VQATVQDVAGLIILSALPFLGIQALADSKYGKELQLRLKAEKAKLKRDSVERERQRRLARSAR